MLIPSLGFVFDARRPARAADLRTGALVCSIISKVTDNRVNRRLSTMHLRLIISDSAA
jgi:hypothetical protein